MDEMGLKFARIIISILEILAVFMKLFHYLQIYEDFGKEIARIWNVFYYVFRFFTFFLLYMLFFAILTYNFEQNFDPDGEADYPMYPVVTDFLMTAIQTWRNSLGDIQNPRYDWWGNEFAKQNEENGYARYWSSLFMIFLIWFVWLMNQYINFIVMSNFLIAIVSQSYEMTQTNRVYHVYFQRCKLNMEYGSISKGLQRSFFFRCGCCKRFLQRHVTDKESLSYVVFTDAPDMTFATETGSSLGLIRQLKKGFTSEFVRTEKKIKLM